MNSFKLIEHSPNVLRFSGKKQFSVRRLKYIEHNGERYSKHYFEDEIYDADKSYVDNPSDIWCYEYNFKMLSLKIKIEIPNVPYVGGSEIFKNQSGYMFSENEYVNFIQQAFDLDLLDSRIKDLYTSKNPFSSFNLHNRGYSSQKERHTDCIFFRQAPILLEGYGFGNAVYYEVSSLSFLKSEYKNIPKEILNYLVDKGIFNKRKNIKNNTLNLLTNKLNYYETNKH